MSVTQRSPIVRISAYIATILFGFVILIQLLIAAGFLPVTMAWGGRQETLTTGLRIAGVVSAILLGLFAYIIRRRAGLRGEKNISLFFKVASWIVTAYMAFNTCTNLISLSITEKMIFTPVTFLLTVACLIVSMSKQ